MEPIKKVTRSIRACRQLILNRFEAKKEFLSGIVEGLNYKVKLTLRKAYGFRELRAAAIALYHAYPHRNSPTNAAEEVKRKRTRTANYERRGRCIM